MTRITIGVITYKRPLFIQNLLTSVNNQILTNDNEYNIDIVIVDNDPEESCRHTIEELKKSSRFPLRYYSESKKGIPFARNCIVKNSTECEFLVFIDDDEVAAPDWLEQILETQSKTGGTIVAGPVYRDFEGTPPIWMQKIKIFTQPQYPEGSIIPPNIGTGNVLIKRDILDDEPFEVKLAHTGGSDSELFMRLKEEGHPIYWSANADTRETIPSSRLTLYWILMRSFRIGCTSSIIIRIRKRSATKQFKSGLFRVVKSTALFPFTLFTFQPHIIVKNLQEFMRGAGIIAGLFGKAYQEYRTIHGA